MNFKKFIESSNVTRNPINVKKFLSLPWNWQKLIQEKVINCLYYYSESDPDRKPNEPMPDFAFSLITLPNLKSIPPNELSIKNRHTGYIPNQQQFITWLKNPQVWYDQKIEQIYTGIKMIGKTPEDFLIQY